MLGVNLDRKKYSSYSSLRIFDHCNRYYYYHYELGLPTEPSFAAEYSKLMIHEPLADLYSGVYDPQKSMAVVMVDKWEELQQLKLDNPYPRIFTRQNATTMIDIYWEKYGQHDLAHFNVVHCEEFLYDDDSCFQSVPDLVLKYTPGSEEDLPTSITVLDHKVSAFTPKPMLSSFNAQLLGQVSVLRYPCDAQVYIGINAFDLNNMEVNRETLQVDYAQLEQYRTERLVKLEHIAQCRAYKTWPRNAPDACIKFSGKTKIKCEFWNQCEKG